MATAACDQDRAVVQLCCSEILPSSTTHRYMNWQEKSLRWVKQFNFSIPSLPSPYYEYTSVIKKNTTVAGSALLHVAFYRNESIGVGIKYFS